MDSAEKKQKKKILKKKKKKNVHRCYDPLPLPLLVFVRFLMALL